MAFFLHLLATVIFLIPVRKAITHVFMRTQPNFVLGLLLTVSRLLMSCFLMGDRFVIALLGFIKAATSFLLWVLSLLLAVAGRGFLMGLKVVRFLKAGTSFLLWVLSLLLAVAGCLSLMGLKVVRFMKAATSFLLWVLSLLLAVARLLLSCFLMGHGVVVSVMGFMKTVASFLFSTAVAAIKTIAGFLRASALFLAVVLNILTSVATPLVSFLRDSALFRFRSFWMAVSVNVGFLRTSAAFWMVVESVNRFFFSVKDFFVSFMSSLLQGRFSTAAEGVTRNDREILLRRCWTSVTKLLGFLRSGTNFPLNGVTSVLGFFRKHRNFFSRQEDHPKLLVHDRFHFKLVDPNQGRGIPKTLDITGNVDPQDAIASVFGSVDGLVLLGISMVLVNGENWFEEGLKTYTEKGLYNPTTERLMRVPSCPLDDSFKKQMMVGLGFDSKADDHKIVEVLQCDEEQVWVFSFKHRSWRRICNLPEGYLGIELSEPCSGTFVRDSLYFPANDRVFAFNLIEESHSVVPLLDAGSNCQSLSCVDESLCTSKVIGGCQEFYRLINGAWSRFLTVEEQNYPWKLVGKLRDGRWIFMQGEEVFFYDQAQRTTKMINLGMRLVPWSRSVLVVESSVWPFTASGF